MPALITDIIPPSGFELVRDALGAILKLELDNQKELQDFEEDINIYRERVEPISTAEDIFINVLLDSSTNSEYTPSDRQGRTIFFIDVNTTGKADPDNDVTGEMDAATRLHKFMGLCMKILSSDHYKTLGFAAKDQLIGGRYVESFATSEPVHREDSYYSRMGRISFAVRIQETNALQQPVILAGTNTTVKLELTNHGYKYQLENPE